VAFFWRQVTLTAHMSRPCACPSIFRPHYRASLPIKTLSVDGLRVLFLLACALTMIFVPNLASWNRMPPVVPRTSERKPWLQRCADIRVNGLFVVLADEFFWGRSWTKNWERLFPGTKIRTERYDGAKFETSLATPPQSRSVNGTLSFLNYTNTASPSYRY
jgi:hypothetical protein